MGFIQPEPPPFDIDEWKAKPYLERLKANTQVWATDGFGAPGIIYVLYTVKLVLFVVVSFLVISLTPGLGTLGNIGDWWTEPIVFQKLVAWTLVWEILGLGSGSMQLTARYKPLFGGMLWWLRPGTVRMPPWPDKVPLTRGHRRTIVDVLLYAGVIGTGIYLLASSGEHVAGTAAGRLDRTGIAILFAFWGLLGLRDKVSFLAGRPEVYGFFLLVSLFPVHELVVGWQFVMFFIWWGAASSKLNRHFPYVISVMVSNTPWNRSKRAKAKLFRAYPDDLRPGMPAAVGAHLGTAIELGLPLVLILSHGGTIGWLAVIGMVVFHTHITSTFALGVPMEWNLFMIFSLFFNFGHYGDVPLSNLDSPLLIVLLVLIGVVIPVVGNLMPEKVSFLPSMRYYAGNWATSMWMFRKDTGAEEKFDERACKVARITRKQLEGFYDAKLASFLMEKVLAFRSLHSHGRALNALMERAVDSIENYDARDGEGISGLVNGWNFGDGHFHDERLLAIVQEQCEFEPGELRMVYLESQPAHVQRQRYRLYDAATGLIEEGFVGVAEMVRRGPWLDGSFDFPVDVVSGGVAAPPAEPAEGQTALA